MENTTGIILRPLFPWEGRNPVLLLLFFLFLNQAVKIASSLLKTGKDIDTNAVN